MCEWPCLNVSGGTVVVSGGPYELLSGARDGDGITGVIFEDFGAEVFGTFLFSGWKELERVVLPLTLVEIGSYAFFKCVSLSEILFPGSLVRLGDFSFAGCTSLFRVDFVGRSELSVVGRGTFEGCGSLKLRFPSGVVERGLLLGPSAVHGIGCCYNCGDLSGAAVCVGNNDSLVDKKDVDEKHGDETDESYYYLLFGVFAVVAFYLYYRGLWCFRRDFTVFDDDDDERVGKANDGDDDRGGVGEEGFYYLGGGCGEGLYAEASKDAFWRTGGGSEGFYAEASNNGEEAGGMNGEGSEGFYAEASKDGEEAGGMNGGDNLYAGGTGGVVVCEEGGFFYAEASDNGDEAGGVSRGGEGLYAEGTGGGVVGEEEGFFASKKGDGTGEMVVGDEGFFCAEDKAADGGVSGGNRSKYEGGSGGALYEEPVVGNGERRSDCIDGDVFCKAAIGGSKQDGVMATIARDDILPDGNDVGGEDAGVLTQSVFRAGFCVESTVYDNAGPAGGGYDAGQEDVMVVGRVTAACVRDDRGRGDDVMMVCEETACGGRRICGGDFEKDEGGNRVGVFDKIYEDGYLEI